MRNLYILLLLISASSQFFGQTRAMTNSQIKEFKEGVSALSSTTLTITSDFIQYKHLEFLNDDVITNGKMAFKQPDLVKWEYSEPYPYSIIFKEDDLLINDGGTKSTVDIGSNRMFRSLNELIVNSVTGNMFDDDKFDVLYYTSDNGIKVIFKPRNKKIAKYIAAFELLFDKEELAVLEVKMIEPSTDFTRIVFKNRVYNSTIDNAAFTH